MTKEQSAKLEKVFNEQLVKLNELAMRHEMPFTIPSEYTPGNYLLLISILWHVCDDIYQTSSKERTVSEKICMLAWFELDTVKDKLLWAIQDLDK